MGGKLNYLHDVVLWRICGCIVRVMLACRGKGYLCLLHVVCKYDIRSMYKI